MTSDEDAQGREMDGDFLGEPADAGAPERPAIHTAHHDDDRPASVRVHELFVHMRPHREMLAAVLEMCEEKPRPYREIEESVGSMASDHRSVYGADNLCELLEKSGALKKVTAEGEPFPEGDPEPRRVMVDGVEYLEPAEPPEVCYVITKEGKDALKEDASLDGLVELFEKEAPYRPVYRRVLELCDTPEGASMPQIDAALVGDPLLQKPRRYATRFVSDLEALGALSWGQSWRVTDKGRDALALLADMEAEGGGSR